MLGKNLKWFGVFLALAFLINATATANASAADLIVVGTTVTLYGDHEYDNVQIINGGILYVKPYDGTAGTGTLVIDADSIVVDATSSINADGAGYRGTENGNGEGPGGGEGGPTVMDGGGGGGYGGKGGDGWLDHWIGGPDGAGGDTYGSATSMSILMGSAGGAAGTEDGNYGGFGGSGGGAISLVANTIDIAGTITANGGDGQIYINDASGGGAGGAILLHAGSVTGSGTLRADGGNGGTSCGLLPCDLDDGGGGGGGGRIKIFYSSGIISASVSVAGGAGSLYGQDGEEGSCYEALTVNIDIKPGSFPNSINPKAGGVIPVAILTTDDFDASTVDPATVTLEGAGAKGKGKSGNVGSMEDIDGDGDLDLVVQIENTIDWAEDATEATLTGETYDGIPIQGTDSVKIVPPN
ncbi:hypothetical protein ACFL5Z_05315 [Planctomycetota bacterium]